jgi:hypothetical protein
MTRATAPGHRRRGEVRQRSTQRRGVVGACVARAAVCCEVDTIPKPDGLAGPVCGPSSNQNRTHPGWCPVLFEPGQAIVRSGIEGGSAVGFAAVLNGGDVQGVADVVEADAVVADAQAELWRLDVLKALHVAFSGGGEVSQDVQNAPGCSPTSAIRGLR